VPARRRARNYHILPTILAPGPSFGQSSYNSRCWWEQGVYACSSRIETSRSVTTTLCGSGGIDSACTSNTIEKEPPRKKEVYYNSYVPVPGGRVEAEKRAAMPHSDPGATSLCPPPHLMTRDGCQ
jgi:hypothetical protein